MSISRRGFLQRTACGAAALGVLPRWGLWAEDAPKLRLSACDWSLMVVDPSALEVAKNIGLDGVEISAGEPADTLRIADPAYRDQYKAMSQQTGVAISSVAMGFLNNAPLATDPRGPAWLEQTIDATKDLNVKVILLAFFGKGDLRERGELKTAECDAVVERLKEAAPRAAAAGVILGLENTLSAKDNLAILDRVQSEAVKVYYDIGNSTYSKYDVPAEIRELGSRICQIHFKDGGFFLGKGKVEMQPVADAMRAINYEGWIVLETAMPTRKRDEDFRANAEYVRTLFSMA